VISQTREFINSQNLDDKLNFNKYEKILVGLRDKFLIMVDSEEYSHFLDLGLIKAGDIDLKDLKNKISRWPIFVFLSTAFICLSFSATFHLFCALGYKYNRILLRLDYAGVCFLIVGSTFPMYW